MAFCADLREDIDLILGQMQIWYLRVIIYRSAQSCASRLTCLKATAHLSSLTERCTSSLLRFQCRHLGMLYSVPLCESPPPLPAPPGCHRDILYQIAKPVFWRAILKTWLPVSLTLVVICYQGDLCRNRWALGKENWWICLLLRLLSSSVDFPGYKTSFLGQVDEVPLLHYFTAVSDIFICTS